MKQDNDEIKIGDRVRINDYTNRIVIFGDGLEGVVVAKPANGVRSVKFIIEHTIEFLDIENIEKVSIGFNQLNKLANEK